MDGKVPILMAAIRSSHASRMNWKTKRRAVEGKKKPFCDTHTRVPLIWLHNNERQPVQAESIAFNQLRLSDIWRQTVTLPFGIATLRRIQLDLKDFGWNI